MSSDEAEATIPIFYGRDIQVGDEVEIFSQDCLVVGFDEHPGQPDGVGARIMKYKHEDQYGDWVESEITLGDDEYYRKVDGVYVLAHLAFHRARRN